MLFSTTVLAGGDDENPAPELIVPPLVGIPDVNAWHHLYRTGLDNDGPAELLGALNTDVWEVTVTNISAFGWGDFHIKFSGGIGAGGMEFIGNDADTPMFTAGPWAGQKFTLTDDWKQADYVAPATLDCVPPGGMLKIRIPVKNDLAFPAALYHLQIMATPWTVPAPSVLVSLAGLVACGRRRRDP